jgi:hypothetical protein
MKYIVEKIKQFFFELKQGFSDKETFSLDYTIAKFCVPRLKRFLQLHKEFVETSDEFSSNVNKMIRAFELVVRDEGALDWTREEAEEVKEGLDLFSKNFNTLWW